MSNILIIKHGSLGDIVQISGALQDIRNQFKDSKIFILTTFKFKNLFERCPFIDEVIVDKRLPRWNFFYLLKLIKNVRSFNFEICFDLQNSSRTNFYRKNFKIKNWSSSLTVLQKDETKKQFDQEGVIERFKVQLDRSNINDTSHVLKPDFSWAIEESFQIKEQKYIFLAPFSSPKLKHKVWPYFKELNKLLKNELPQYDSITAPGPSEIGQCKDIGFKMILDNDKPTSIGQLAKVIKQSSFVIANDTGPAHIAAHLGCKGVALFGHHTSAKKVSIETEKFKAIESNSLKEITPEQVLKFVKDKILT